MAHPAVDALRVKAHGDAVRTLHDQGLTWVTFDPIPDLVCDIDFGIRKLPELGLLSGTVRGVRHVHAHRDSGDGNDDFSFHLNVSGLSTVVSRRGETTLRDGDAMLLSYSAGRTINRPALVDHRVIRLPRASLRPLVHDIDDAVLRPIPRGTGMLNLLRGYADALFDDPVLGAPRRAAIVSDPTLRSRRCHHRRNAGMRPPSPRVVASARRGCAPSRADIEAAFGSWRCLRRVRSPGARRMSDSYIRKLFEGEETSFSEFVLTPPARARTSHADRSTPGRPDHRLDCIRVRLRRPVLFQSHVQAFLRRYSVGDQSSLTSR